jgi:hypothetical protein
VSGRPTPERSVRRRLVRSLLAGAVGAGAAAAPARADPTVGFDRPGGFVWADSTLR